MQMKKILYLGWIGYNNLGDDLLWHIFRHLATKYFNQNEVKIIPSLPSLNISNLQPYDTVVLGGGSLIAPTYIKILYKALQLGKKVIIWGSGIDRIAEAHLKQMNTEKQTLPLTRFSGNEVQMLKEVFANASFTGVRGPYTKKILERYGVKSEQIQIIGDPALLLQPINRLEKKKNLIGINWGSTMNNIYGGSEAKVKKHLVNAMNQLMNEGYEFFLYSVWKDDLVPCQKLYQQLNAPEHVFFNKKLYSEQELMSELSACTLTINFKLHPNLLSLSAGTPAIALGHRFKVFDLFHSLDFAKYVISTSFDKLDEEIIHRVEQVVKNRDKIITKYNEKQTNFQRFIEEPFINKLFI